MLETPHKVLPKESLMDESKAYAKINAMVEFGESRPPSDALKAYIPKDT
jgi:hypothetical protein